MDYQFSINDIASKTGKSYQSILALIKKNQDELKQYSKKYGRFIKYNKDGLQWFLNYYGIDYDTAKGPMAEGNDGPSANRPSNSETQEISELKTIQATQTQQIEQLKAELERITKEKEKLQEELDKEKAEKTELIKQNGLTLLLLQQEKQQNLLLLPAATKKTVRERVSAFFSKSKAPEQAAEKNE